MNRSTRYIGSWAVVVTLMFVGSVACNGGDGQQTDGGEETVDGDSMDGGADGADDDTDALSDTTESDGSANDGGETDTGRPSVYGDCRQTCERARDCGLADEWVCESSGYCDFHQCNRDIECVPWVASWSSEGCQNGDCEVDGDVCVEHNGTTYCAGKADGGTCRVSTLEPTAKPKADGSGDVQVCVPKETNCKADNTCEGNRGVERRCDDDTECDGLTCNDRDRCACESDQQCINANRGDNWECLD